MNFAVVMSGSAAIQMGIAMNIAVIMFIIEVASFSSVVVGRVFIILDL